MSELPISIRRTKPNLFAGPANVRGPLDAAIKARLRAVIDNPTSET